MATDFELFYRYQHLCFKIYLLFKIANWLGYFISLSMMVDVSVNKSHVAQSCYIVIGDKPFLWSKPKFDPR